VPVVPTVAVLFWLSTFASIQDPQSDDVTSESPSLFNAKPISNLHYKPSTRCKFYVLVQVLLLSLLTN
jgi:hypothetical protein